MELLQQERSGARQGRHRDPHVVRSNAASGQAFNPNLTKYLPWVVAATLAISICPILVVWALGAARILNSTALSVALVMALSVGASYVGGVIWRSRSHSKDLLFSELMLWGWLRRWWTERRLASALELIKGLDSSDALSGEKRKEVLSQLASALEARDPYTHGHCRRVARNAAMIAKGMHLPAHQIAKVQAAAVLHDVGKIDTPREVLNKPGRLTDAEFDEIERHPARGAEMVAELGDPELTAIVRHHHERLDGTGYPDRLRGEDIPLGARIIAVADTFDAITSTRPYRPARPHKLAMEIISGEAGTQLDPAAVHAFREYYSGRRPLALWLTLTNVPGRLLVWLTGGSNVAAATSLARVMATTAVTGAVVAAAVHTPSHVVSSGASAKAKNAAYTAKHAHGASSSAALASGKDSQHPKNHNGSAISGASGGKTRVDRASQTGGHSHGSGAGQGGTGRGSSGRGGASGGGSSPSAHSHPAAPGKPAAPGNGHGHAYGLTGGNGKGLGAGQGNGHAYGQTGGNGGGNSQGNGGGQGQGNGGGNSQSSGGQGQGNGGGNGHGHAPDAHAKR